MKGILIDVEKCEIREVELKAKLEDYYRLIKCDLITCVSYPNMKNHDVICDDEGLLKEIKGMFSIDDDNEPQIAGNGLILKVTAGGNWVSSKLTVEDVKQRITFWKVVSTDHGRFIVRMPKKEG